MTTTARTLAQALDDLRKSRAAQGKPAHLPSSRPASTTQFETVDSADYERDLDARRRALTRSAGIQRHLDALAGRLMDEEIKQTRQAAKPVSLPNATRRANKPIQHQERPAARRPMPTPTKRQSPRPTSPYAHLGERAIAIWTFIAAYVDQHQEAPRARVIAEQIGATVSEVMHEARRLENNQLVRVTLFTIGLIQQPPRTRSA